MPKIRRIQHTQSFTLCFFSWPWELAQTLYLYVERTLAHLHVALLLNIERQVTIVPKTAAPVPSQKDTLSTWRPVPPEPAQPGPQPGKGCFCKQSFKSLSSFTRQSLFMYVMYVHIYISCVLLQVFTMTFVGNTTGEVWHLYVDGACPCNRGLALNISPSSDLGHADHSFILFSKHIMLLQKFADGMLCKLCIQIYVCFLGGSNFCQPIFCWFLSTKKTCRVYVIQLAGVLPSTSLHQTMVQCGSFVHYMALW